MKVGMNQTIPKVFSELFFYKRNLLSSFHFLLFTVFLLRGLDEA
jgi:hypothetical protein